MNIPESFLKAIIGIITFGLPYSTRNVALAQIASDNTVGTEVNQNGSVSEITGGETRGSNLFHSFREFSVQTGNEAFFNNAEAISNIFSRVTGGKISNIDGLIRANGNANLFLLNPAGIIFGENASLDIGGSFYGSTADSILFEDGEFSATDLDNPPLLTINAPIGLSFRDNPEAIVNQSVSNNVGLRVNSGETISFSGGNVSFDGGMATAPDGRVEVLGDKVSLFNNAKIDVSSETGGGTVLIGGEYQGRETLINASRTYIDDSVRINADAFTDGNGGRVIVWADEVTGFYGNISARGGSVSGNGGFVEVSGKEHLIFRGDVDTSAVNGFTGTLLLDPTDIVIANGSGDGAEDGTDSFAGNNSGEAGSILSTPLSEIDDTAPTTIFESELEGLSGNTNVILQATNDITIEDLADDELTFAPGRGVIAFTADADRDGAGDFVMEDNEVVFESEFFDDADTIRTNGRNIAISGANLTIGNIDTSLTAPDNAGDNIETAQIVSSGSGVALESISGNLSINDSADVYQIFIRGDGTFSASTVDGTVIDTQLFLFDAGGFGIYGNDDAASCDGCFQSTLPAGDDLTPTTPGIYYLAISEFEVEPISEGGRIFPNAFDTESTDFTSIVAPTGTGSNLPLTGFDSEGFERGDYTIALTGVEGTANTFNESEQIITGNGGTINLNATNGDIIANSLISFSDSGDGGAISLNAIGDIFIGNEESLAGNPFIDSFSSVGNGGEINLNSSEGSINITNASISSDSTAEVGDGGDLSISADDIVTMIGSLLTTTNEGEGQAGDVNINAGAEIQLTDTGIDAAAFGINGRTGNITIESTKGNVELVGQDTEFPPTIFTDSFADDISGEKTGGDIRISGKSILIDGYNLDASVNGIGNGGDILITGDSVTIQNNTLVTTETFFDGNAGNIAIDVANSGEFSLSDSSIITSTSGGGNAGNITVNAGSIALNNSTISAEVGQDFSGDFGVDTELFLFDEEGNLLAENDISEPSQGAEGSFSEFNSFIEFTFTEDGNYTIGVGAFDSFAEQGSISGEAIPQGQNYTLQVSVEDRPITLGADGLITKVEPNNSLDTAQNLNSFFSTDGNPNIQNSTSIPHVSISAEGDGTFDYYSFDATAGSLGIFDIDEISTDDAVVQPGNVQAGNINLNATGNITITNSSVTASTAGRGLGGNVNITTPSLLTIRDNSTLEVSSDGLARSGNIVINSGSLTLENEGRISARTDSGKGGLLDINVDDTLLMRDNSRISANAGGTGDGGNIDIDAGFVIASPNQNNDIVTSARSGDGGNITITTEALLGLDERRSRPRNNTNDIDVSSQLGLSGDFTLEILDVDLFEGSIELPTDLIEPEQTVAQACRSDLNSGDFSSLIILGKGGVPPKPTEPFNSDAIIVDGRVITPDLQARYPDIKPIKTQYGDIFPARGVIKTKDGRVILTAYPTDNIDSRIPHNSRNCVRS